MTVTTPNRVANRAASQCTIASPTTSLVASPTTSHAASHENGVDCSAGCGAVRAAREPPRATRRSVMRYDNLQVMVYAADTKKFSKGIKLAEKLIEGLKEWVEYPELENNQTSSLKTQREPPDHT